MVVDIFNNLQSSPWAELVASAVDIVHCSAFFHLFPLSQQIEAAKIVATVV